MERKGVDGRINMVRKDRGFTADKLSELWASASPSQQEIVSAIIQSVFAHLSITD